MNYSEEDIIEFGQIVSQVKSSQKIAHNQKIKSDYLDELAMNALDFSEEDLLIDSFDFDDENIDEEVLFDD